MAAAQASQDLTKKYKRKECENLLKQKFFFTPSFEIYGGVSGLYDYGPLGSQLKSNVEHLWRQHFVLEEDMLEVGCSNLTLDQVLETSVRWKVVIKTFRDTLRSSLISWLKISRVDSATELTSLSRSTLRS
jgi:glycyl-tRNA synthetase (class II)